MFPLTPPRRVAGYSQKLHVMIISLFSKKIRIPPLKPKRHREGTQPFLCNIKACDLSWYGVKVKGKIWLLTSECLQEALLCTSNSVRIPNRDNGGKKPKTEMENKIKQNKTKNCKPWMLSLLLCLRLLCSNWFPWAVQQPATRNQWKTLILHKIKSH